MDSDCKAHCKIVGYACVKLGIKVSPSVSIVEDPKFISKFTGEEAEKFGGSRLQYDKRPNCRNGSLLGAANCCGLHQWYLFLMGQIESRKDSECTLPSTRSNGNKLTTPEMQCHSSCYWQLKCDLLWGICFFVNRPLIKKRFLILHNMVNSSLNLLEWYWVMKIHKIVFSLFDKY